MSVRDTHSTRKIENVLANIRNLERALLFWYLLVMEV